MGTIIINIVMKFALPIGARLATRRARLVHCGASRGCGSELDTLHCYEACWIYTVHRTPSWEPCRRSAKETLAMESWHPANPPSSRFIECHSNATMVQPRMRPSPLLSSPEAIFTASCIPPMYSPPATVCCFIVTSPGSIVIVLALIVAIGPVSFSPRFVIAIGPCIVCLIGH